MLMPAQALPGAGDGLVRVGRHAGSPGRLLPAQNVGVLVFSAGLAIGAIRQKVVPGWIDFAGREIEVRTLPRVDRDGLSQIRSVPVGRGIDGGLLPQRGKSLLRG